jgi:hypothetical protein
MIFEISLPVFQALGMLDDWIDQTDLGGAPEIAALVDELVRYGLVEVHA